MNRLKTLTLLGLLALVPLTAAAQVPVPRPAQPRGDDTFPFPFPFPLPSPFGELLKAGVRAKANPPGPNEVAAVRYLQSRGVPPTLFIIEPTNAGGAAQRLDLYELDPSSPTAVGRKLYELLKGMPDAEVERFTKKKLYVVLTLLKDIAAEEGKSSTAAFPETLQALNSRLRQVMAMEFPEDAEFAGLGTDRRALYEALEERRKVLNEAIARIENQPTPDEASKKAQAEQLAALRSLYGQLGTLEFDPAGRPLIPSGLYQLVRAVPESALTERQWRTIFYSFPMGRSLWDMRVDRIWRGSVSGQGIKVAILDVGIDRDHPDLGGAVTEEVNLTSHRFTAEHTDPSGRVHRVGDPDHRGEHGTHVASTVHAIAPGATIVNIKVLDEEATNIPPAYKHDRTQVVTAIYDGLDYVLQYNRDIASGRRQGQPIQIVSMSLGLPGSNTELGGSERDLLSRKVKELADAGVIVVVATGNEGNGTARRPGMESSAITVGAVDYFGRRASFASNRTIVDPQTRTTYDVPTVWAFGHQVWGADYDPSGKYEGKTTGGLHEYMSGTSMATPHVAGAMALILDAARQNGITLTPAQAQQLLIDSSTPLPGENPYARTGGGALDVNRAIRMMVQRYGTTQPSQPERGRQVLEDSEVPRRPSRPERVPAPRLVPRDNGRPR